MEKEKKKYIFSYVSKELHKAVKEHCAKNETTIVSLLEKLLEAEMRKGKNGKQKSNQSV